jgi:hypothetical protein
MIMKIVEAQGYSKEKALNTTELGVGLDRLKNATMKWKKAGSPVNSGELKKFMEEYIHKNKVVGGYIVVDPSSDDTRSRPYTVINEATKGSRKYLVVYQVKEGAFKVTEKTHVNEEGEDVVVKEVKVVGVGATEAKHSKKSDAVKAMKELIVENKKDYIIEIAKEAVEGQPFAAYGQYTPSKSAKEGKFLFFVED